MIFSYFSLTEGKKKGGSVGSNTSQKLCKADLHHCNYLEFQCTKQGLLPRVIYYKFAFLGA